MSLVQGREFVLKCTQGEGRKAKQIEPSDASLMGIYGMFYLILVRKNITKRPFLASQAQNKLLTIIMIGICCAL